ncbi:MAG: DUF2007 domain-containing protein [Cocleimonas sp.]|nr:DUF2007 domain-containing protein [Cocleimonas sp.]
MSKLVTITSFTDSLEANIVKGRLEVESIPVFLSNEYYINVYWGISNALGGVQLKVPIEYEKQAKMLIKEIEEGEYDISSQLEAKDKISCPQCDSIDVKKNHLFWKIPFIALHFLSILLPFTHHSYRCKQCQKQWKEDAAYSNNTIIFYILLATAMLIGFVAFMIIILGSLAEMLTR